MTREELSELIDNFISGENLERWAWDDFISVKHKNEKLENVRLEVLNIEREYPPTKSGWCSEEGITALSNISSRLQQEDW